MRTAADLAAAIPGGVVKESTIQNVEAGRKAELTVSQLLNIALALRLPPVFLLAPMGNPHAQLDLANLSDGFESMSAIEFDAWLSGQLLGAYRVIDADEHRDRVLLDALRELDTQSREKSRLERTIELEKELLSDARTDDLRALRGETKRRYDETIVRVAELSAFLKSAGWNPPRVND
jgi:hypothetical protein